ncbi:MAG: PhnA domain-containing protein [Bacteroidia bacterium]|nr:PhnA domain-containing protein [Bacteroidia bacterium]
MKFNIKNVSDSKGNMLNTGDLVHLIKDLKIKGSCLVFNQENV